MIRRALRHQPVFVQKVLQAQQKQGLKLQRQLSSLAFHDVPQRIRHFLIFHGEEYGKIRDGVAFVPSFLTHRDIALINHTSRPSVTSALAKLKAEKAIYYDRHQLIIYLEKLKKI